MTANDWWQENKRFAVMTASGALVFVIGLMLVDSYFGQALKSNEGSLTRTRNKLANEKLYVADQLAALKVEHQGLVQATDELKQAVAFQTRAPFLHDPKKGAAGSQYFQLVDNVREDLLTLAGRASMRLPEELGLPGLSPTREPDVVRYLEGLDLVDRAVHLALAARVERIDKIAIQLDPKLNAKDGVGTIERTRVPMTLGGNPAPLVHFLLLAQEPKGPDGTGPLLLEKCEMIPARTKSDEATLEVVFLVVRLHDSPPQTGP